MKQRCQFTLKQKGDKSQLTDERVERLNSIGFSWTAPTFRKKKDGEEGDENGNVPIGPNENGHPDDMDDDDDDMDEDDVAAAAAAMAGPPHHHHNIVHHPIVHPNVATQVQQHQLHHPNVAPHVLHQPPQDHHQQQHHHAAQAAAAAAAAHAQQQQYGLPPSQQPADGSTAGEFGAAPGSPQQVTQRRWV
jgi:hypothetical protein